MNELNNRISAQRETLKVLNGAELYDEPLFSLTEKAINRWAGKNGIDTSDAIVSSLKSMSKTLFFLANKSQEQITEEYTLLSKKVGEQLLSLRQLIASKVSQHFVSS